MVDSEKAEVAAGRRRPYLWELRPYFGQVRGLLVVGSIAGLVSNITVVLPAVLIGRAVDVALAFARGEVGRGAVGRAALAVLAAGVAVEVPKMVKRWWLNTAWAAMRANLRSDAYRGVLRAEPPREQPVGDVVSRIVGDVEVVADGFGEVVFETWDDVVFSISLVVMMIVYDPGLTVWALAPVPLALVLSHAAGRSVSRRTTQARVAAAELSACLEERIAAVSLLRLSGATAAATTEVSALSARRARAQLGASRVEETAAPLAGALLGSGAALVLWRGGQTVVDGGLTVGALVGFFQLYLRFVGRAPRLPRMVSAIRAGGAAYDRVRPLLAAPGTAESLRSSFRWGRLAGDDASSGPRPRVPSGPLEVSLERLTFSYGTPAPPGLVDVTLELPAGSFLAVTGPAASGKTTLARLVVGLDRPTAGMVTVGGAPPLGDVRRRMTTIGYLPQDPPLFTGTVADNVLLGSEVDPDCDDLAEALAVAGLAPDLAGFPDGLATRVGEQGLQVSGGQRQRICVARALAAALPARPGLLVLDDPFSAVDVETEGRMVRALVDAFGSGAPMSRRATIVLCSVRLAAFPSADLVVVLERGRVAERGTHAQLVAAGGPYARMYRRQNAVRPTPTRSVGNDG